MHFVHNFFAALAANKAFINFPKVAQRHIYVVLEINTRILLEISFAFQR